MENSADFVRRRTIRYDRSSSFSMKSEVLSIFLKLHSSTDNLFRFITEGTPTQQCPVQPDFGDLQ